MRERSKRKPLRTDQEDSNYELVEKGEKR